MKHGKHKMKGGKMMSDKEMKRIMETKKMAKEQKRMKKQGLKMMKKGYK